MIVFPGIREDVEKGASVAASSVRELLKDYDRIRDELNELQAIMIADRPKEEPGLDLSTLICNAVAGLRRSLEAIAQARLATAPPNKWAIRAGLCQAAACVDLALRHVPLAHCIADLRPCEGCGILVPWDCECAGGRE